jgi:hypothetical protein
VGFAAQGQLGWNLVPWIGFSAGLIAWQLNALGTLQRDKSAWSMIRPASN